MTQAETLDLFESPAREPLCEGAVLLPGLALLYAQRLIADVARVLEAARLRFMVTPGGFRMSVAMTNCGSLGWVTTPVAIATMRQTR